MNPLTNRFIEITEPGKTSFKEIEFESLPLKPDYIRLKIAYCGICGTDVEIFRGRPGTQYPVTLGHEYYGSVIASGNSAGKFPAGAYYAVDPNFRCGTCQNCLNGLSNHCVNSSANLFFPRGFAKYIDIHHSYLVPIPRPDIPYLPALIEPLSVVLHAMEIVENNACGKALILGSGGMGSMLALTFYAKYPDTEVDLYDIIPDKSIRLADTLGMGLNALETEPPADSYPLIFEATGRVEGMALANRSLAKKGTIVAISRYSNQRLSLEDRFSYKEGTIQFVHLDGNGKPFKEAVDLLYSYWSREFDDLADIHPLSELPGILEDWDHRTANKTIIRIDEDI